MLLETAQLFLRSGVGSSNVATALLAQQSRVQDKVWGACMLPHHALSGKQEVTYTFAVLTCTSITLNILCVYKAQKLEGTRCGVTQSAEGTVHWSLE